MKKVQKSLMYFAFIIVLTLGTLVFQSCDKDPIGPPPPVTYTMTSIISGKGLLTPEKLTGIKAGSNLLIKFIPEKGYSLYKAKINGQTIEEIFKSETDVPYNVTNINSNLLIEPDFVLTSISRLSVESTSEKAWTLAGVDCYDSKTNQFLWPYDLTDREKRDKYYFLYPSKEIIVKFDGGGTSSSVWDIKDSVFQSGNQYYKILEISQTTFKYKSKLLPRADPNLFFYTISTYKR